MEPKDSVILCWILLLNKQQCWEDFGVLCIWGCSECNCARSWMTWSGFEVSFVLCRWLGWRSSFIPPNQNLSGFLCDGEGYTRCQEGESPVLGDGSRALQGVKRTFWSNSSEKLNILQRNWKPVLYFYFRSARGKKKKILRLGLFLNKILNVSLRRSWRIFMRELLIWIFLLIKFKLLQLHNACKKEGFRIFCFEMMSAMQH